MIATSHSGLVFYKLQKKGVQMTIDIDKLSGGFGRSRQTQEDAELQAYQTLKQKAKTSKILSKEEKAELKRLEKELAKSGKIDSLSYTPDNIYQQAQNKQKQPPDVSDLSVFFNNLNKS